MKQLKFDVPIFDIEVILIQVESIEDKDAVLELMKGYDASEDILEELDNTIYDKDSDGASTFWNSKLHRAITVFYEMESQERKDICYAHEKRHIEDRILEFCGIDDRETAGYLAGWLMPYFNKLNKESKLSD